MIPHLQVAREKKLDVSVTDKFLTEIATVAGVDKSKLIAARFWFEGSDPSNPRAGTPQLAVAFVEGIDLATAKARMTASEAVAIISIDPDAKEVAEVG